MPKEITINDVVYVPKADAPKPGPLSIVRTRNAGVHIGKVESIDGQRVDLTYARRLYRWRGANTLNEATIEGVNRDEYTRISKVIPSITLLEACEVIPVAEGVDFGAV